MAYPNMSKKDAEILRAKYELALADGKSSFMLMGQEVLVSYAKYLIVYLESQGVYDDR